MRPRSEHPTALELQILTVLWERKNALTVREVKEALSQEGRDLAHTSVITTLFTMVEKGQVEKLTPTQGKAFRFAPISPQEDVSKRMLSDLVERAFGGSVEAVMLSLFDISEVNGEDLKRLRKLFNQKMREQS